MSPDGSRLALIGLAEHFGRVEVLTFSDGSWHEIAPERSLGLPMTIAWAADGKGLFVTCGINDSVDLQSVTLTGKVQPLLHKSPIHGKASALPPDGKCLAYEGSTMDGNIWMLENF